MTFSSARHIRINSLTAGALVQLRFGKAATKDLNEDVITQATFVRHETLPDSEKMIAVFEEVDSDSNIVETTISRYPKAPWQEGTRYVSLVGIDLSTFVPASKPTTSKVSTDSITSAIRLIAEESEEIFGAEDLIALLELIQNGKRMPNTVKAAAETFAAKITKELEDVRSSSVDLDEEAA